MVVVRDWTREWWREERRNYLLVSSVAVVDELERGDHSNKEDKIDLLAEVEMLAVTTETDEIVEVYLRNKLMPGDLAGDARHLAVASFHKCDYLLTWNCRHLANANKVGHIRRINAMLGLPTPQLVTPLELISETP
jgi:predicted nucleic acid-binding protein